MATFNATALKAHVEPAPRLPGVRRGFLVFNKGKETRFIPEEIRGKLVGLGVIAGEGGADSAAVEETSDGLDDLTKAQLRERAEAAGLEIETDANKATMIEKLRAAGVTAGSGSDAPAT